jgi:hypothetical protein
MRKSLIISGFLVAWSLAPGTALAFEQKPAAPAPSTVPDSPKQAAELKSDPQITGEPEKGSAKHGWKIPGLGSINLLPKLDFGLELLYGDDSQQNLRDLEESPGQDDVVIRGTVKRRF